MKKKLLLSALALVAVLSVSGCGGEKEEQTTTTVETTTTTKSAGEKIGDGVGEIIDGIGGLL